MELFIYRAIDRHYPHGHIVPFFSTLSTGLNEVVLGKFYGTTENRHRPLSHPYYHRHWRDKQGHEVDFIWTRPGKPPIAIECKWNADHFEARNLKIFRRHYQEGANWVVCQDVREAFSKKMGGIIVEFFGLDSFREKILRGGL